MRNSSDRAESEPSDLEKVNASAKRVMERAREYFLSGGMWARGKTIRFRPEYVAAFERRIAPHVEKYREDVFEALKMYKELKKETGYWSRIQKEKEIQKFIDRQWDKVAYEVPKALRSQLRSTYTKKLRAAQEKLRARRAG
jgi:hypothetical protein